MFFYFTNKRNSYFLECVFLFCLLFFASNDDDDQDGGKLIKSLERIN